MNENFFNLITTIVFPPHENTRTLLQYLFSI